VKSIVSHLLTISINLVTLQKRMCGVLPTCEGILIVPNQTSKENRKSTNSSLLSSLLSGEVNVIADTA